MVSDVVHEDGAEVEYTVSVIPSFPDYAIKVEVRSRTSTKKMVKLDRAKSIEEAMQKASKLIKDTQKIDE